MALNAKSVLAALAIAATGSAFAGTIPYPNTGAENATTYTFTAAATGDLTAYFMGTGATYDETLGVLINGVDSGVTGLENHTTAIGTALDFGPVTAGDTLTFYIDVSTTGDTWFSNQAMNGDGVNHVYSTSYAGGAGVPAGTYVGFEDLPSGGDFNYTDEQFVFTNVASSVPEPASAALLLAGVGLLGLGLRRRAR